MCSYFACRNAGIKFRYCVYCKLPVAKRNFAKRHRHWGKIAPSDLPKDILDGTSGDDDLSTSEQGTMERIEGDKHGDNGDDERDASVATYKQVSPPADSPNQLISDELLGELMTRNVAEVQQEQTPPKEPLSEEALAGFIEERRKPWEELLLERPKLPHGSAMLAWVQEILRVSDMGEALPPATSVIVPATATDVFDSDHSPKQVADTQLKVSTESKSIKDDWQQLDAMRSSETGSPAPEASNGEAVTLATQLSDNQAKGDGERTGGREVIGESAIVAENRVDRGTDENDRGYDDDDDDENDCDDDDDKYDKGEKEDGEIPDDASTSSEDSVDLRSSKKARISS